MGDLKNNGTNIFFIQNLKMDDFDYDKLLNNYIDDYSSENFNNPEHALNYLEIVVLNISLFPDKVPNFIFLDLYFIGKIGFDFLKRFDRINQKIGFKIKVIATINSTAPYYRKKCLEYESNIICINRSSLLH